MNSEGGEENPPMPSLPPEEHTSGHNMPAGNESSRSDESLLPELSAASDTGIDDAGNRTPLVLPLRQQICQKSRRTLLVVCLSTLKAREKDSPWRRQTIRLLEGCLMSTADYGRRSKIAGHKAMQKGHWPWPACGFRHAHSTTSQGHRGLLQKIGLSRTRNLRTLSQ